MPESKDNLANTITQNTKDLVIGESVISNIIKYGTIHLHEHDQFSAQIQKSSKAGETPNLQELANNYLLRQVATRVCDSSPKYEKNKIDNINNIVEIFKGVNLLDHATYLSKDANSNDIIKTIENHPEVIKAFENAIDTLATNNDKSAGKDLILKSETDSAAIKNYIVPDLKNSLDNIFQKDTSFSKGALNKFYFDKCKKEISHLEKTIGDNLIKQIVETPSYMREMINNTIVQGKIVDNMQLHGRSEVLTPINIKIQSPIFNKEQQKQLRKDFDERKEYIEDAIKGNVPLLKPMVNKSVLYQIANNIFKKDEQKDLKTEKFIEIFSKVDLSLADKLLFKDKDKLKTIADNKEVVALFKNALKEYKLLDKNDSFKDSADLSKKQQGQFSKKLNNITKSDKFNIDKILAKPRKNSTKFESIPGIKTIKKAINKFYDSSKDSNLIVGSHKPRNTKLDR